MVLLCFVLLKSTADISHGFQADGDGQQHGEPNRAISGDYGYQRAHDEQTTDDTCDSGI